MKGLGYITATLIIIVLGTLWSGYVFIALWDWFLVPVFNFRAISIPEAIGFVLVIGYLTHQIQEKDKNKDPFESLVELGVISALKPAMYLLFGWIVSGFLGG